jgi:RES domain-containing protein
VAVKGTPLSAVGSQIHGGRYNRKNTFEAFHISDTQQTALYETEAVFNFAGVIVGLRQPPRVILSLDYDLQYVLDLRAPTLLERLDVTIDDLKRPWKVAQADGRPVLTQRIGAAARAVNIEALLVPSARVDAGANLVVFPDRLRVGSSIELYVGGTPTVPRYGLEGRYVP